MIANPRPIPIALNADDIAYKTGLLFSPKWLKAVFLPRLKRLNDVCLCRRRYAPCTSRRD